MIKARGCRTSPRSDNCAQRRIYPCTCSRQDAPRPRRAASGVKSRYRHMPWRFRRSRAARRELAVRVPIRRSIHRWPLRPQRAVAGVDFGDFPFGGRTIFPATSSPAQWTMRRCESRKSRGADLIPDVPAVVALPRARFSTARFLLPARDRRARRTRQARRCAQPAHVARAWKDARGIASRVGLTGAARHHRLGR